MDVKTLFHSYGISLREWAETHGYKPNAVTQAAREWFFGTTRKPGCPRGKKKEIVIALENQINIWSRGPSC